MVTDFITWKKIILLVIITLICVGLAILFLPIVLQPVATHLPTFLKTAVSDYIALPYERKYGECNNPAGKIALDDLVVKLANDSNIKQQFNFEVIDDPIDSTAFATPGNRILLFAGIIEVADTPEQLAGVLAHEMSHAILFHPELSLLHDNGLFLMLLSMFGKDPSIAHHLLTLKYSRDNEFAADANAVTLLTNAKVGTKGLIDFLSKIQLNETNAMALQTSLRSHPNVADRIAAIEELSTPVATQPILNTQQWLAIKSICVKPS